MITQLTNSGPPIKQGDAWLEMVNFSWLMIHKQFLYALQVGGKYFTYSMHVYFIYTRGKVEDLCFSLSLCKLGSAYIM